MRCVTIRPRGARVLRPDLLGCLSTRQRPSGCRSWALGALLPIGVDSGLDEWGLGVNSRTALGEPT
jgi:hypothetical protein